MGWVDELALRRYLWNALREGLGSIVGAMTLLKLDLWLGNQ
jgi:uncharacterized protein YqgC (DUF456 family)